MDNDNGVGFPAPEAMIRTPELDADRELRKAELDSDLKKTARWLSIAFLGGWLGVLLRFGFSHKTFPATGAQTATSFIWSLAWLAAGFVFGFIFGIPKVITATTSTTNPALNVPSQKPAPKLKVNTNLEDISDWLTKILVGATLTQITRIPAAIRSAAWFMAAGDASSPTGFNGAIIIYYSALGFLSGYILTRMFFARAFESVD